MGRLSKRVKNERGESSRALNDEGVEVADVAEETLPSSDLPSRDRRLLRSYYRELEIHLDGCKSQLAQMNFRKFKGIVDRAEDLHKDVSKPREQIIDAKLFLGVTNELLAAAKGAQVKGGMSAAEFVGAIVRNYGLPEVGNDSSGPSLDWEAMGLDASAILRHAPGIWSIEADLRPIATKVRSQKRQEKPPIEKSQPQVVEEVGVDQPNTETDATMATMFKTLTELQEVELSCLVLNRSSFAQTVENLFALSFLVKDGRVEITISEKGNQLVVPRNAPAYADRAVGDVLNTQFVFRLDFKCWRLMQDTLPEGSEVMPHRGDVAVSIPAPPPRSSTTPIGKSDLKCKPVSGEGSSQRLQRKL